jgi:hypothetical protein
LRLCVYYRDIVEGKRYPSAVNPEEKPRTRTAFTSGGLVREVSYLHEDEVRALAERARKERASKAEIIRRALRAYLGIED